MSLYTAEKQHSIGEVWLPYYDTRLYNTSTIHRVSRRPKFVVLIYFHTTTTLLVIRHLLGLVCHIIETINVHQRGDPQGSYAISALEHAGEHRGTLWALENLAKRCVLISSIHMFFNTCVYFHLCTHNDNLDLNRPILLKNLDSVTFEAKTSYYQKYNIWIIWHFLAWPNVSQ